MNKFLIVGLGNIGAEYSNTRHNIGFKIVNFIAENKNISFNQVKLGSIAELKIKGKKLLLLKPSTYMNLSGKAVRYWMEKEKIPLENILVITDDLNLPFATMRIKPKGSDGGHNGLRNIQEVLQTTKYARFRFGISDLFKKGKQVDYVLGKWQLEEQNILQQKVKIAEEAVISFVLSGINHTMNNFNGK